MFTVNTRCLYRDIHTSARAHYWEKRRLFFDFHCNHKMEGRCGESVSQRGFYSPCANPGRSRERVAGVCRCAGGCARETERPTEGLAEAYQLICLGQRSSHLYLPVQLAAVHTHNSFLWIRCQAPASCRQLFDHFLYLYISCTSAQRTASADGISLFLPSPRVVLNTVSQDMACKSC